MTQIDNHTRTNLNRRENEEQRPKRVSFSIDPLAPLATDENIVDDAWRQSQLEDPERWDGMS